VPTERDDGLPYPGPDRGIIGKNIQINRESYRVAAVIPPMLDSDLKADLWMPLTFPPARTAKSRVLCSSSALFCHASGPIGYQYRISL
jgi:hypothetical protein